MVEDGFSGPSAMEMVCIDEKVAMLPGISETFSV